MVYKVFFLIHLLVFIIQSNVSRTTYIKQKNISLLILFLYVSVFIFGLKVISHFKDKCVCLYLALLLSFSNEKIP